MIESYYNIPIVIFTLWISYRFYKRLNEDENTSISLGTGCFAFGALALSYLILVYMTIFLLFSELETLYENISMEQYTAKVSDVNSYEKKYKGKIRTFYIPTIKFTPPKSSKPIVEKLKNESRKNIEIGQEYNVLYDSKTSRVIVASKVSVVLIIIGLVFLFLIIYSLYYIFSKP